MHKRPRDREAVGGAAGDAATSDAILGG